SKYLTNLNNLTFTLIIAFTFFLPKAAYLQPEILYYTLSYLVFIFFLKILRKNRLKDVFFCGILIALAYLTKATMLLGFLIFIFFQTANLLIQSIIVISKKHPPKMLKNQKVKMLKVLSTILLSTLIFIGFLSFYLIENRKTYGEYFFNSGTNIYLWYDSWPEVLQASKDGIDKPEIWNMIPKNQKPSLINYLKGHSFAEMTMRTVQGTAFNLWMLTTTYSSIPFTFALFCLISLTYMFLSNKCVRKEIINTTKESLLASTFVICYFTLHILAFSWYWFVGSGSRFILSLYLPYLFLIFYLFDKQKNIKKKGSKLFYLISISFLVIYTITITIPILYNFWCGH
ncbi:hypothetical protein KKB40_04755, partial [Patescibacteria group bacterium]|nr:hypothetical protein [Patescibacteria group bacterium]